jgi:membrane protein
MMNSPQTDRSRTSGVSRLTVVETSQGDDQKSIGNLLSKLPGRLHRILLRLKWLWGHTVEIALRSDSDHVFMLAAGIAFNIIISLVPTVLVLLFVLGYVLDSETVVQQLNKSAITFIVSPGYRNDIIETLRQQIDSLVANRGITAVLGFLGLLWSSSALATSIRVGVNKILRCREVRSYFIYKAIDISSIALIGLLVFVSVLIGPVLLVLRKTSDHIGEFLHLYGIEGFITEIVNLATTLLLFWIIFRYIPYQKLERHIIWIGTLVSTALWAIARYVFSFYLSEFTTFSRVYGAYAFFAAAAFWLYYSSLVFLIGAEVAYHIKQSRWNARRLFNRISTEEDGNGNGIAVVKQQSTPMQRREQSR